MRDNVQDTDFIRETYVEPEAVDVPTVPIGYVGGLNFIGRTSSAADPTVGEFPLDGDAGFHENTSSGDVFLVLNQAGAILKVLLT